MAKTAAKKAAPGKQIVKAEPESSGNVPAYLRRKSAARSTMRVEDLIIPRVKLVQALSKEVEEFDARPGTFWHTVNNEPFGNPDDDYKSFDFIVFGSRYFYVLFAPRGDARLILARASDGVHWQPSDGVIKMKPKGATRELSYKLAPTVEASGLHNFGTLLYPPPMTVPEDARRSPPAATLVYEYMIYTPSSEEQLIMLLARSQIKKGRLINTAIAQAANQEISMTGVRLQASVMQDFNTDGESFWNWQFRRAGWATEEEQNTAEAMAKAIEGRSYRAAGEETLGEEAYDSGKDAGGPKDVPKNAKGF